LSNKPLETTQAVKEFDVVIRCMVLTQLGDVSTIAKTLVETLNDVLQNLDTTGSVNSSVVHAGRAQTLAKFFYDRNDRGRGSIFE